MLEQCIWPTAMAYASFLVNAAVADTYEITLANLLEDGLPVPFVVTGTHENPVIFSGDDLTKAGKSLVPNGNTGLVVRENGTSHSARFVRTKRLER